MLRVSLVFFCVHLAAQNDSPTFRATSQLVEVSVVAQDKKGNPVLDLRKEDFTLLDSGKPRPIAFFRYEGEVDAVTADKLPTLPPHVFTNRAVLGGGRARNVTALLLDSSNMEIEDQMLVNGQSKKLLNAFAPQTLAAVFQMGREFRVLHDFTDDKSSLNMALEGMKVEFPNQRLTDLSRRVSETDALLAQMDSKNPGARSTAAERARMALASDVNFNSSVRSNRFEASMRLLESVGAHIAGIPGRKTLVWISGGISTSSMRVGPGVQFLMPGDSEQYHAAMLRTSQRLAQSGVVLYAVDARGLLAPAWISAEHGTAPPIGGGLLGSMTQADSLGQDTRAAFALMTSITGGRYFVNTNDFSEGITKSQSDLRGTYLLAFYGDGEADGKWRSLKATVNRPGVELLYRKGYQLETGSNQAQNWSAEQLRSALRNPLGSSAIRLNAHCMRGRGRDQSAVTLTLQIEPEDVFFQENEGRSRAELEVTVGEKTVAGDVRFQQDVIRTSFTPQQLAVAREKGIPYTKQWKPGADTAVVRVLVRDRATDRVGTVDVRYD